jgi:hypothetical protein
LVWSHKNWEDFGHGAPRKSYGNCRPKESGFLDIRLGWGNYQKKQGFYGIRMWRKLRFSSLLSIP